MNRTSLLLLIFIILVQTPFFAQAADDAEDVPDEIQKEVDEAVEEIIADGDLDEGLVNININGEISLNYVFAESPDSFVINYSFNVDQVAKNKIDILKGELAVKTEIKGFLAKWPSGECKLKVGMGKIPYELIFNRTNSDDLRIDFKVKGNCLETWESNCTFTDAPQAKFDTVGNPEKWFCKGLQQYRPSLRGLKVNFNGDPTTQTFELKTSLLPDRPIGSVEITGKGSARFEAR